MTRLFARSFDPDILLEPNYEIGENRCECEKCPHCHGKPNNEGSHLGCKHGDDKTCFCEFCDCGELLNKNLLCVKCDKNPYSSGWVDFIGYQEGIEGDEPFALFNIMKEDHPQYRSTVCEDLLKRDKLPIPAYPSFSEWKNAGI
jgi:hypothetical protein